MKSKKPAARAASAIANANAPGTKSVALEAFIFAATFLLIFLPANYALSSAWELRAIAAHSSQFALSLMGTESQLDFSNSEPRIVSQNFEAEINSLCAAATELAVLLGIVVASRDRSWKHRAKGVFAGVALVFLFNPLRIAGTLYFFNSQNILASSLLHDVLFRASIVVFIVTFYAAWYFWEKPSA